MNSTDSFRRDLNLLEEILHQVVSEDHGAEILDLIARIRRLSHDRRANVPGSEALLSQKIESLSEDQIRVVTRFQSLFFDLVNIAEDRQRIRVLRKREQLTHPDPISESIGAAIQELKRAGFSPERVQTALDQLDIELVFTAHPSEAKRRSIRSKLRRMRQSLQELDRNDLLPRERSAILARTRADLTALWQTEFLRPMRPSVLEEVERGLSIMPRLWQVVPAIYQSLRIALAAEYPDAKFKLPCFLRFGSWMGGDRDGHPDVTFDVTERTLTWLRDTAIDRHLECCRKVYEFLTVSRRPLPSDHDLADTIAAAEREWPEFAATLSRVSPGEIYRRWVRLIEWRLRRSRCTSLSDPIPDGAYRNGAELERDVARIIDSLQCRRGHLSDAVEVRGWLDLSRVFGLHLTRLDIRQDATRYREVMKEILNGLGICRNFDMLDEPQRQQVLISSIGNTAPLAEEELGGLTRETLQLFRLLRRVIERFGPDAIGGHVISMTRYPSDILTVLWLWHRACGEVPDGSPEFLHALRIVPLFEKIGDLKAAPEVMSELFHLPAYATHLAAQNNRQIIMVGYSDSTKDGGYLAACWGLDQAQDKLHQVAVDRNVRLTFFHGRGGSLGRGGGPAARGILSLPPDALGGSLRLTEQGEVLSERYDDVPVAYRHLEQVTWATLVASNLPRPTVRPEWRERMDQLSEASFKTYRALVETPGFIDFFGAATPIEEIENLQIASRPSRRTGQRTLKDLRAIPWVFAWTQNRCIIPAWYGLGDALTQVKYGDRSAWQMILEMYRQWPFFQAMIDNAATALAKADMYIGQCYTDLCTNHEQRLEIWKMIAGGRDRSRQAILDIVGGSELLSATPWFQESIEARNPDVDPLNLIQIELLRRRRQNEDETEQQRLRELLRLTVQGVAAGMRTTG